jgi:cobalt-zinc-cadmium efflux system membrane fusion protein
MQISHASAARKRTILFATAGVAAVLGFAAGHSTLSIFMAAAEPAPKPVARSTTQSAPPLAATVAVSGEELANMQVHLGKAQTQPLIRTIMATGSVGYDQLRLARITPPARGRIDTLNVVVGDQVAAGQRLAVLDNFELSTVRSQVASAEAAVSQAKAGVVTAQAALARAISLVRTGGMAQSEVDARRATAASMEAELRTRQAELRQYHDQEVRLMPVGGAAGPASADALTGPAVDQDLSDSRGAIVAPFKGVVDSVSATQGEIVDPSTQMFTVADLSTVWVQADVVERDLGAVRVGDAVQVRVSAYPGRIFNGRVTYISDQIDPMTGTAKVRCVVPNPDGALRINMFATTSILAPLGGDAVMVPSSTLQDVNGQSVVFIPVGKDRFAWRAVHTGLAADGQTQITGGLAAGTPVVTDGSYWLKAALMKSTIPDEG